uniref:Uncharacterized protein n=1 Tax=Trichuris muris TaxID=70415 RepID=A0A5S6QCC3_TRIMR
MRQHFSPFQSHRCQPARRRRAAGKGICSSALTNLPPLLSVLVFKLRPLRRDPFRYPVQRTVTQPAPRSVKWPAPGDDAPFIFGLGQRSLSSAPDTVQRQLTAHNQFSQGHYREMSLKERSQDEQARLASVARFQRSSAHSRLHRGTGTGQDA